MLSFMEVNRVLCDGLFLILVVYERAGGAVNQHPIQGKIWGGPDAEANGFELSLDPPVIFIFIAFDAGNYGGMQRDLKCCMCMVLPGESFLQRRTPQGAVHQLTKGRVKWTGCNTICGVEILGGLQAHTDHRNMMTDKEAEELPNQVDAFIQRQRGKTSLDPPAVQRAAIRIGDGS